MSVLLYYYWFWAGPHEARGVAMGDYYILFETFMLILNFGWGELVSIFDYLEMKVVGESPESILVIISAMSFLLFIRAFRTSSGEPRTSLLSIEFYTLLLIITMGS